MRQPYTRGFFVHLYLNGQYWGLYNIEERPVDSFGEAYLGGDEDDYDVLKVDAATSPPYQVKPTAGTNTAATRSARFCTGAFFSWASVTSRII